MSEPTFALQDEGLALAVSADGTVDVRTADGRFQARGLRWRLLPTGGTWTARGLPASRVEPGDGGFRVIQPVGYGVEVDCRWALDRGRAVAHATLHNARHAPVRVQRVCLSTADGLGMEGGTSLATVFKMGWNVAAASGFLPASVPETAFFLRAPYAWLPRSLRSMMFDEGTGFSDLRGDVQSEWFSALADPSGRTFLFGFAGSGEHFSQVRVDAPDGLLSLQALLDDAVLPPGVERPLEPVVFVRGDTADAALQSYARAFADRHGARVNPVRLWCSWYSGMYDRVTEESFLDNARRMREAGVPADWVQLDDGWQAAIGDWLQTNRKFPSGLPFLAAECRRLGFDPGIWTAPFAVSPRSRAYRDAPDRVVRDEAGRPVPAGFIMGALGPRFYYGLDTTRDDVLATLEGIYGTLRAMGWRLFKVDFLTAASVAGVRSDPTATRAQAYRRGLEAVRRAVGEDAVLLSGIGPVLGNAGIMDVQRLGPDTSYGSPHWRSAPQRLLNDRMSPGLFNNISGSLGRCFTDGILWSGDGDALEQQDLPAAEATALAVVALLTGGTVSVGHDTRRGAFDGALVRRLAGRTGPAWVPDRHRFAIPRQLACDGVHEGRPVRWVALVNTLDVAAAVAPDPGALPGGTACDAVEIPGEARVRLDPMAALLVPPHGVRLFEAGR